MLLCMWVLASLMGVRSEGAYPIRPLYSVRPTQCRAGNTGHSSVGGRVIAVVTQMSVNRNFCVCLHASPGMSPGKQPRINLDCASTSCQTTNLIICFRCVPGDDHVSRPHDHARHRPRHRGGRTTVRNDKHLRLPEHALWTRKHRVGLERPGFLHNVSEANLSGIAPVQLGSSSTRADRQVQIFWLLYFARLVPFIPVAE